MEENKDTQERKNASNPEDMQNTENQNAEKTENLTEEMSLEEQLAHQKDLYIRLFAEFENYKKRTLKEKTEFAQYANQNIMISMLAILDDFERALKELAKSEETKEQLKGVELIYNKFKNSLIEKGLKVIEVKAGDDFNVDFHEAITQIPAPSEELKGKIDEIKDFMFTVTTDDGKTYALNFDKKPEGLENVKDGDEVIVHYSGELSEVDSFTGEILSVEKA